MVAGAAKPARNAFVRPTGVVWLAAVFAIFLAVRLANLTTFCLDTDEVFSVRVARLAWPAMLNAVARDAVHPPLFYAVLKCWIALGGESRLWLRLLPLAFSLASAPLFVLLCRRLTPRPTDATLAFLFLAVNPYQVFHSQYVRMYSLAFLLSVMSMLAFERLVRQQSHRLRLAITLTVANIALAYTHYFAWLLIATEVAYVALYCRERLAAMLTSAAATAACSGPWLWLALTAAEAKGGLGVNLGWIARPNLGTFFWHFAGLNGPIRPYALSIALIIPFTAVLVVGLRGAWTHSRHRTYIRMLLTLSLAPPVTVFLASNVGPHAIWESRYLIMFAAPYFLLMAIAIGALAARVRRFVVAGTTAFLLYGAVQLSAWPDQRVDIESVARRIAAAPAPAFSFDHPLAYTLRYYVGQHTQVAVDPVNDTTGIRERECWIVTTNHCRPGWREQITMLERRGYRRQEKFTVWDEWNEITAVRLSLEKKTAPAEP